MATEEQLDTMLRHNGGEPFFVQINKGRKRSKWIQYPQWIYEKNSFKAYEPIDLINQVQIVPSYIVFDIDIKNGTPNEKKEQSLIQGELIFKRLTDEGYKPQLFYSGGKGHHLRVRFKGLNKYITELGLLRKLKSEFLKKFGEGCDVELMKACNKTLIQLEDTPHHRSGMTKVLIKGSKKLASRKLPTWVDAIVLEYRFKAELKRRLRRYQFKIATETNMLDMPCVKLMMEERVEDGNRDNVFFTLFSILKKYRAVPDLLSDAYNWVTMNDNFIQEFEVRNKIRAYVKSPSCPGCRHIQTVLECMGKKSICEGCVRK